MEGVKNTNEGIEEIKQQVETQKEKVEIYKKSLSEARAIFNQLFGGYPEGYKAKLGEGSIVKKFNELIEERRISLHREEGVLDNLRDRLYSNSK